jgi:hypothetical protein
MEPSNGSAVAMPTEPRERPAEPVSWPAAERFLGYTDDELRTVDPVVLNLVVAKGIPSQANLDISRYIRLADQ